MKLEVYNRFSKNISYFTKIRLLGAELFHAGGQTERDKETNSHFLQIMRINQCMGDTM
jgi:hypothetical protein